MNFIFHPFAREELNQAVDYYEECEKGLGYNFLEEVFATIKEFKLIQKPGANFPPEPGDA